MKKYDVIDNQLIPKWSYFILGEFPTFTNDLTLTTDNNSSNVHETTVNTIPIMWGPSKRK
jgi:hypothetical protein